MAQELDPKLEAEILELDKQMDELLRQQDVLQHEIAVLKERRTLLTGEAEIRQIDDIIADAERQLDHLEQQRNELLERRELLLRESNAAGSGSHSGIVGTIVKKASAAPFTITAKAVKSGVKTALTKSNPFDRNINQNNVGDSGMEGMRLAYTSAKKVKGGIKTVSSTVKTTERTIKTTGKAVKETGKITVKVVRFTVRAVAKTAKYIGTAAASVVALIPTPILLILLAVLLFLIIMLGSVTAFMGGAAAGANTLRQAYENASGLDVPAEDYVTGQSYYGIAMTNAQNRFHDRIFGLYYDTNDLSKSDLVYFRRTSPGNPDARLERSELASDAIKAQICQTWLPCLSEEEVIAITYVYLQKQQNDAQGTDGALYMVEFSQETFDTVVAALYAVTEVTHEKQECPDKDCDIHKVTNPTWTYFDQKMGEAAEIINGVRDGDKDQARIDYENYKISRDNTPKEIDESYCPKEHTNHSIALTFYDRASVLMKLGISDSNYAQWVNMTVTALENLENTTEAPTDP